MNIKEPRIIEKRPKAKTINDKFILNRLDSLIDSTTKDLNNYDFSIAGMALKHFTWHDFADWYLETAKIEGEKEEILLYLLQNILKLWHPFTPFITEVIWKNFNADLLLIQKWPETKYEKDEKTIKEVQIIQNIVNEINKFKNENKLDPGKFIECLIISKKYNDLINEQSPIIEKLARVKNLENEEKLNTEIHLPHIKIYLKVDVKKSNDKEIANLEKYIKSLKNKLNNEKFIDNAPQEIVEKEKEKLLEAKELLNKIVNK